MAMKILGLCFMPFRFTVQMLTSLPVLGSSVDSSLRFAAIIVTFGNGGVVAKNLRIENLPKKPLELYSFVACPFCRKAEEAISTLQLDVVIHSVPKTSMTDYGKTENSRFREEAKQIGGKVMFPLLIDPNTDKIMYESSDIVKYLWKTYGKGAEEPLVSKLAKNIPIGNFLVRSLLRPLGRHGMTVIPASRPEKDLILYGYEGSPYVLAVREVLCSMEMRYLYKTLPKWGNDKRKTDYIQYFKERGVLQDVLPQESWRNKVKVLKFPVLEDPNTGIIMAESMDIVDYLYKTYAKVKM